MPSFVPMRRSVSTTSYAPGRSALGALLAVGGLVDLVAGAAQHHRERRAHVALVVDDEDLRPSSPELTLVILSALLRSRSRCGPGRRRVKV